MQTTEERRRALASAITRILSCALSAAHEPRSVDVMVYGKRFERCHLYGTDYYRHSDTFSLLLNLGEHVCDLVLVLRYADLRIGLLLPNQALQNIEQDCANPFSLISGKNENERLRALIQDGFGAYPAQAEGYPRVLAQQHHHGLYVEYCFAAPMSDLLNQALLGSAPIEAAADAIGYSAAHIYQKIFSYIYSSSVRQHTARGMGYRVSFLHRNSSAELIRNYNLEPAHLEIVREATLEEPGEYVLSFLPQDREKLEILLLEIGVELESLDNAP
ncbi:MAG: hypothetical protein N2690_00115 [Rhodocyclaceae bacterium]|nr:hypothetical protein [Rhodocyclaceae bacterium]